MTHLSMKAKMALVVGLFTVVIGIIANIVFTQWNAREYFSTKELYGTEFYQPSFDLIKSAQLHRGNGIQVAKGVEAARGPMLQAATAFESALNQLKALELKYRNDVPMGDRLENIERTWQSVKASPTTMAPAEGFAAHTRMIEDILVYIEFYSDQSNLTLDPEVNSFYLMQLMSFTLPRAIEYSARMRGAAAASVANGPAPDAAVRSLIALKPIAVDKVEDALRSARKASDSIDGALSGDIVAMQAANDRFASDVQQIIDSGRSDLDSRALFARGTDLVSAGYTLQQNTVPHLQRLLQSRIESMQREQTQMMMQMIVAFLVALGLTVLVIRNLLRGMNTANQHLSNIQRGQLDGQIDVQGTDEIASLLTGVRSLQTALRETREREQVAARENEKAATETARLAAESKRLADALMVCDTSVMIADADYNIVFMNHAVTRMLERRNDELGQHVPNFNLSSLMGANMDIFHKDPSHQRGMVSKLKAVYRTRIKVGSLTFSLIATPLFDEAGARIGTIVEWDDMTDQLAQEQEELQIASENQRVRIALDNGSTNTMIADANNQIVYMNKALQDMMSAAESDLRKDLPSFQVSKLMGANMDVFHKNPAHQQRLIRELKDTYEAQIKVGGRTFRLVANPVLSDSGERLGTVVEWLDRTQEVIVENEVNNIVQAAAQGDFSQSLPLAGKQGFFANLANGLNELMKVTNDGMHDIARVLSALAAGDLTQKISADYDGLFKRLKDDANATVDKLEEVIANIIEASSSVTTGANEIAQGNADLSQRTEEQASSLEETASSMEEMTGAVQQTSDNAQHANQLSQNAVGKAEAGGQVVKNAVVAMEEINSSSKRIADIIGVIDEIAFQTNLLALNAAVEAARAGEQGRGFAVVAGEVRNLAQRSAGAAKEIKDLIRDSVKKVEAGTDLVNRSGTTLSEIVEAVREVTAMIGDINAAASEQSSSIIQINQAVGEMDEMTQQNAALVEQASAAGEAMAEQARSLMNLVGFFKLDHSATMMHGGQAAAPRAAARPAPSAGKAAPPKAPAFGGGVRTPAAPSVHDDDEWEEF
ncbi:methyl-accepting chemotaxis protein [Ketobacter sp.]|uniref:methyl-accepting chemotaxis protein n=1 Tax=Ketobacter sp. TaxID=2083498 RepID=UPI0025BFD1AC|nr:methyl-accepting chemotaxis protein [Ketobacter sp.]